MTADAQQLELKIPARVRKPGPEDVALFVALLERETDWITAGEILLTKPVFVHELMRGQPVIDAEAFKRLLRALREASGNEIIGSGRGYMLLKRATAEDVKLATEPWIAQGKKMIRDALATRAAWHRLPGRSREELAGKSAEE